MRRWTALLVLLVALFGAASSAFACAPSDGDDCCPPDAPSKCPEQTPYEGLDVSAAVCCITPSAPSQRVSVQSLRKIELPAQDDGSPDPVVIFSWLVAFNVPDRLRVLTAPIVTAHRADAALTYLHTGRLRL